jgi:hypothetical protein
MGGRDGLDNGQAESVSVVVVSSAAVEALKWLEETVNFTGWDVGTGVGHQ